MSKYNLAHSINKKPIHGKISPVGVSNKHLYYMWAQPRAMSVGFTHADSDMNKDFVGIIRNKDKNKTSSFTVKIKDVYQIE